jgi:predicted kinase
MRTDKVLVLLRGVSGAGKSTCAKFLFSLDPINTWICSADQFFIDKDGNYKFDKDKLYVAHQRCKMDFMQALSFNKQLIIIDNTNTSEDEISFYIDRAQKYGYTIFSLVVENRNGTSNVHNVPLETIHRQAAKLRNSIKLI